MFFKKLLDFILGRKPNRCYNCTHAVHTGLPKGKIRCTGLFYPQTKSYDFTCDDFLVRGDQGV